VAPVPDDLTKSKLQALGYSGFADAPPDVQSRLFLESADEVQRQLEKAIENGESIGVETVLSSDKYRALVERTIVLNGRFRLIYISLNSPAIAVERVAARVGCGGHAVPKEKIKTRFSRSYTNLTWFAHRAHSFWVLDNSDSRIYHEPRMLAFGSHGVLESLDETAPVHLRAALAPLRRA